MTPITANLLGLLPLLRLVVTSSVGVDHIDQNECRRRGIKVANIAKIFKDDVADMAVGLLVDVLRKVSAGDKFVRSGSRLWSDFPLGNKVRRLFTNQTSNLLGECTLMVALIRNRS